MKKPGVSNDNWVFNKISNNINSEIFTTMLMKLVTKELKSRLRLEKMNCLN